MITDYDIERAVSSTTPTATVTPPPELLAALHSAVRTERRRHRVCKVGRVLAAAYVAVGATAGIVALVIEVAR